MKNIFLHLKHFIPMNSNSIIFRYILKQLFVAIFSFLFVLVGIAWLAQVLRLISFMVSSRISVSSFLYFTMLLLPTILTNRPTFCIVSSETKLYAERMGRTQATERLQL